MEVEAEVRNKLYVQISFEKEKTDGSLIRIQWFFLHWQVLIAYITQK